MNKLIKRLVEGLFDDFDDDELSISNDSNIAQQIIENEDKPKVKQWLLDNIICKYGDPFKAEEGNDIEFFMVDGELHCNLTLKCHTAKLLDNIPDYIKIDKVSCYVLLLDGFKSFTNLPKEIDGTLHIYKYMNKELIGDFPENIGELNLTDSKIRSLKNLNNTCNHIQQLYIENCNMLTSFDGIPENVEGIKLVKCKKIQNLEGIPETVNDISLVSLSSFDSLSGCPKKLNDNMYILDCKNLNTLTYSPSLILGNYEVEDCFLYQLDMTNCRICGNFKLVNNQLNDLQNGPYQIDGSYFVKDKYLKRLQATDTKMTNVYNNAKFTYCIKKTYFQEDNTYPLMDDSVKIQKEYI